MRKVTIVVPVFITNCQVSEMKHWSGENPDKDDKHGPGKRPGTSESDGGPTGKDPKCIADYAKKIPLLFLLFQLFGFAFH
jgi:hypothetical protein